MFKVSCKKWVILLVIVFLMGISLFYLYSEDGNSSYKSSAMIFKIEKKEHHIESGKYIKMWVIGSNANDSSPNKERFQVMIEDSRIYNLLEEGNRYFVNIQGVKNKNQSEYVYTFGQLGLEDGTQLTGKGKID